MPYKLSESSKEETKDITSLKNLLTLFNFEVSEDILINFLTEKSLNKIGILFQKQKLSNNKYLKIIELNNVFFQNDKREESLSNLLLGSENFYSIFSEKNIFDDLFTGNDDDDDAKMGKLLKIIKERIFDNNNKNDGILYLITQNLSSDDYIKKIKDIRKLINKRKTLAGKKIVTMIKTKPSKMTRDIINERLLSSAAAAGQKVRSVPVEAEAEAQTEVAVVSDPLPGDGLEAVDEAGDEVDVKPSVITR